jgi:hypothetical protein
VIDCKSCEEKEEEGWLSVRVCNGGTLQENARRQ